MFFFHELNFSHIFSDFDKWVEASLTATCFRSWWEQMLLRFFAVTSQLTLRLGGDTILPTRHREAGGGGGLSCWLQPTGTSGLTDQTWEQLEPIRLTVGDPAPPHTHTPPSGSIKSTGLHSHWYFSVPAYSRWGGFVKTGLHTNISSVFKVCRWSFPEWRKRLMVPTSVLTQKPLMDWGQFHQAVQTCFPHCSNSPHGLWENVSPEAGSTQNHRSNWTAPVDCSPHQPPTHQHFPRS